MYYCSAKVLMKNAKNNSVAVNRGEITVERRMGPSIERPADNCYVMLSRGTVTSNNLDVIE